MKNRIGAAKTASKRLVQKTEEAAGDLLETKQLTKLLQQIKQNAKKKKTKQIKDKKLHTIRKKTLSY